MRPALHMLRLLVFALVPLAAAVAPAAEPDDYRSQRFFLRTDLPADEARQLLEELEEELTFLARYWGRASRDVIQCFVVAELEAWADERLPSSARKAVESGAGTTLTSTIRIRDKSRSTARVYAAASGGSLKHEVVHGYCRQAFSEVGPLWYAEGMAELGQYWTPDEERGANCELDVPLLLRSRPPRTLDEIVAIDRRSGENYAWSWSLCHLCAHHPYYRERFQEFGRKLLGGGRADFKKTFARDWDHLALDHRLFIKHLARGYRVDLCGWDWDAPFAPPEARATREMTVEAARGWQPTGLLLREGQRVAYRAAGGWRLTERGRQVSAAGNADGSGRLVGMLLSDQMQLSPELELGRGGTLEAPVAGRLYVRCRDAWHELADNQGSIALTLPRPQGAAAEPADTAQRPPPASPQDAEAVAARRLRLASLLVKSNPQAAARRLREIIQKFPDTKAAAEARRVLETLP